METVKNISVSAENYLNRLSHPLKPYLSNVGRLLLVVTFFEDAFRMCIQYPEQLEYLKNFRHFPAILANLFLFYCIGAMVSGSILALSRVRMYLACGMLASVLVIQSVGYGVLFYFSFLMRNLSLIGGVLLLLAESMHHERKIDGHADDSVLFRGLPTLSASASEKATYVLLFGRVLLIFLFVSLMYNSGGGGGGAESTNLFRVIFRGLYFLLGSAACLMVAVGFKARYSAMVLVAALCIVNMLVNQWWKHAYNSPERDFLRYDFFQTLSVIGGFMLLLNGGPGDLSFDKKKKEF